MVAAQLIVWLGGRARLVREESGDEEISAHACQEFGMAGYFFLTNTSDHARCKCHFM
jgi:hypothetical protein